MSINPSAKTAARALANSWTSARSTSRSEKPSHIPSATATTFLYAAPVSAPTTSSVTTVLRDGPRSFVATDLRRRVVTAGADQHGRCPDGDLRRQARTGERHDPVARRPAVPTRPRLGDSSVSGCQPLVATTQLASGRARGMASARTGRRPSVETATTTMSARGEIGVPVSVAPARQRRVGHPQHGMHPAGVPRVDDGVIPLRRQQHRVRVAISRCASQRRPHRSGPDHGDHDPPSWFSVPSEGRGRVDHGCSQFVERGHDVVHQLPLAREGIAAGHDAEVELVVVGDERDVEADAVADDRQRVVGDEPMASAVHGVPGPGHVRDREVERRAGHLVDRDGPDQPGREPGDGGRRVPGHVLDQVGGHGVVALLGDSHRLVGAGQTADEDRPRSWAAARSSSTRGRRGRRHPPRTRTGTAASSGSVGSSSPGAEPATHAPGADRHDDVVHGRPGRLLDVVDVGERESEANPTRRCGVTGRLNDTRGPRITGRDGSGRRRRRAAGRP